MELSKVNNIKFRTARVSEINHKIKVEDFISYAKEMRLNSIKVFSLHYFSYGISESTEDALENVLKTSDWQEYLHSSKTFTIIINVLAEFLLYLYHNDKIIFHPILKFHNLTNNLANLLKQSESQKSLVLYQQIIGIHIILSREIELFLKLLDKTQKIFFTNLKFVTPLKADKEVFANCLQAILKDTNIKFVVKQMKVYNSPSEVVINFVNLMQLTSFFALFLASRFRLQLTKIDKKIISMKPNTTTQVNKIGEENELLPFDIKVGRISNSPSTIGFQINSIFPGNLYAELSLLIELSAISKLKKILTKIIISSEEDQTV